MAQDKDITHSTMTRILSVENIAGLVMTAFMIGAAYSVMAKDLETAKDKANKNAALLEQQTEVVNSIQIDVAEIKANQEADRRDQARQQRSIEKILDILENRR